MSDGTSGLDIIASAVGSGATSSGTIPTTSPTTSLIVPGPVDMEPTSAQRQATAHIVSTVGSVVPIDYRNKATTRVFDNPMPMTIHLNTFVDEFGIDRSASLEQMDRRPLLFMSFVAGTNKQTIFDELCSTCSAVAVGISADNITTAVALKRASRVAVSRALRGSITECVAPRIRNRKRSTNDIL